MHADETPRARLSFAAAFATLLLAIAPTAGRSQEALDARSFETSDGTSIRYTVTGLGDPIVLLHGIMSSAQQNWEMTGVIDRLAEEFQVIGGAGWANRELDGLPIFDPEFAGEMIAWLETGEGSMPLGTLLWPGDQQPAPEMLKQIGEAIRNANDPLALAAVVRGMEDLVVSAELLRINKVPILNIVGSDDPLRPAADALVGVMGEHRLHMIDGANHMTTLFNPEFADTLRAFFIELCDCA